MSATNGAITKARRVTEGSDLIWNITVRPRFSSRHRRHPCRRTRGCASDGSICTADGTELINSPAVTIAVAAMMRWAGCAHDLRGRRPLWRRAGTHSGSPVGSRSRGH